MFDAFSAHSYLVVGGNHETIEVVELINSNSTPSFGELPTQRWGTVGGILGNALIVCGGGYLQDMFDTCLTFDRNQWNESHSMNEKRRFAAGVGINSTTFWILGGWNTSGTKSFNSSDFFLYSTEFIVDGQAVGVPGTDLPYAMGGMCAVKLSEKEIFLIGGEDESNTKNEVWIFNPQNGFERMMGPPLNIKRSHHSCGTMRDHGKTVIVVAGGYENEDEYLDSVEIYDPTDNTWNFGK